MLINLSLLFLVFLYFAVNCLLAVRFCRNITYYIRKKIATYSAASDQLLRRLAVSSLDDAGSGIVLSYLCTFTGGWPILLCSDICVVIFFDKWAVILFSYLCTFIGVWPLFECSNTCVVNLWCRSRNIFLIFFTGVWPSIEMFKDTIFILKEHSHFIMGLLMIIRISIVSKTSYSKIWAWNIKLLNSNKLIKFELYNESVRPTNLEIKLTWSDTITIINLWMLISHIDWKKSTNKTICTKRFDLPKLSRGQASGGEF